MSEMIANTVRPVVLLLAVPPQSRCLRRFDEPAPVPAETEPPWSPQPIAQKHDSTGGRVARQCPSRTSRTLNANHRRIDTGSGRGILEV